MSNFNIDKLKNTWQSQNIKPKYNSEEILKMLNKKSRNYVKYIYWISLAEFILFFGLMIFYQFNGTESEAFYNLIEKLGIEKNKHIEENYEHLYFALKIVSTLIGALFVYRFFKLMKKVQYEENLKSFISNIISFRKTVQYFIMLNILLVFIYVGTSYIMINQLLNEQNVELYTANKLRFNVGIIIATVLTIIIIWLYYRIIYGIIMSRLNSTLKQLKEIDSNNDID